MIINNAHNMIFSLIMQNCWPQYYHTMILLHCSLFVPSLFKRSQIISTNKVICCSWSGFAQIPFYPKTWKCQKHGIFVSEYLQSHMWHYFWEIESFLITIRMIDSTQLIHAYDMKIDNWKNTKMHIIMLCWFAVWLQNSIIRNAK